MIPSDIRDRTDLTGDDILNLNFIQSSGRYKFRKYYRSGLRSLIFEVLDKQDLDQEENGIIQDGIKTFPRALPQKIFRIFRTRFSDTPAIFREIRTYNLLLSVLGTEFIAKSEEFIVDYIGPEEHHILLCGLQEYINGEILDPWKIQDPSFLDLLYQSFPKIDLPPDTFKTRVSASIKTFVSRIREMVLSHSHIPDLAGVGNLIVTPDGQLKLVDINNIVPIHFNSNIPLDDKEYPACDVSVQVLFMLEENLLNIMPDPADMLFLTFIRDERMKKVKQLEKAFYETL